METISMAKLGKTFRRLKEINNYAENRYNEYRGYIKKRRYFEARNLNDVAYIWFCNVYKITKRILASRAPDIYINDARDKHLHSVEMMMELAGDACALVDVIHLLDAQQNKSGESE